MISKVNTGMVVFLILFISVCHSDCQPSNFEVLNFNYKVIDSCKVTPCPRYNIVGELKNNCNEDSGAEIRITGRGKDNQIIDTKSGWPASTRNIRARNTEPFNFGPLFSYDPDIETFEVEIIRTNIW